ncbi:hypothetical protein IJT93_03530 [bacterium]|nr:hypothetical protein [bacterium]
MMNWPLNGGYFWIFCLHMAAMAVCVLLGLFASVKKLHLLDWLLCAVLAGAAWLASGSDSAVNVCCDEFYYASTARHIVQSGKVYPQIYKYGVQGAEPFEAFVPPYPQGWPCLQACMLKLFPLLGGTSAAEGAEIWTRAVSLNRGIYILLPVILFLSLRLNRGSLPSAAAAFSSIFMPFLMKLSSGGSAELACLLGAELFFFFLQLWNTEGGYKWLLCLGTAGAFWGEMRPEGAVGAILLFFIYIVADKIYRCGNRDLKLKPAIESAAGLLGAVKAELPDLLIFGCVFGFWWLPGLAAMICHPPQLDHHFQMIPRGSFTVWENRFVNIINDLRFFADNRLFPVSLTLLALAGLLPGERKSAADLPTACALWGAVMTLFLAMFPFGDYTSEYSFDSWRFAYVTVIPWAVWAAWGAEALLRRKARGAAAVSLCLIFAVFKAFTFAPPKGCRVLSEWNAFVGRCAEMAGSDACSRPLLCSDEEMCLFFKEKYGRDAFLYDGGAELDAKDYYVCMSRGGEEYAYSQWYGWDIKLLDEFREVGWGFFMMERE